MTHDFSVDGKPMTQDFIVGGVVLSPFVPELLLAALVTGLLTFVLMRLGFYQLVWHRALVELAMSGTFTMMLRCQVAMSSPSRTMASHSVLTTSALMGPSTISVISMISCLKGLPLLAASEGLVVTPSIRPIDWASLISSVSPESIKIFTNPPYRGCWAATIVNCVGSSRKGFRIIAAVYDRRVASNYSTLRDPGRATVIDRRYRRN